MNENKQQVKTGTGFLELLTLTFIVLKLCNVIDWSWWFVLSPILIPISLAIIIIVLALIVLSITKIVSFNKGK